jgi:hypothetical protein
MDIKPQHLRHLRGRLEEHVSLTSNRIPDAKLVCPDAIIHRLPFAMPVERRRI